MISTDSGQNMEQITDDGRPERKSTPTPKFLGTAEAYFVCHIGQNLSDIFDSYLHWVSVVRLPAGNS